MAQYEIFINMYLQNVSVNFIGSLFRKIFFMNNLIEDDGNFLSIETFQENNKDIIQSKAFKGIDKDCPRRNIR